MGVTPLEHLLQLLNLVILIGTILCVVGVYLRLPFKRLRPLFDVLLCFVIFCFILFYKVNFA